MKDVKRLIENTACEEMVRETQLFEITDVRLDFCYPSDDNLRVPMNRVIFTWVKVACADTKKPTQTTRSFVLDPSPPSSPPHCLISVGATWAQAIFLLEIQFAHVFIGRFGGV